MEKIIEEGRIVSLERVLGQIYRLRLHCPKIARAARPGQFVMLRVREGTDPLLRRPFSFSRIYALKGELEILFRVVGRGTLLLSRLPADSTLSLVGPLGNGFTLPADKSAPLAFIAGGIGIAPLLELIAQVVGGRGQKGSGELHLFYGARSAVELLPEEEVTIAGLRSHFATDDGSFGYQGRITRMFEDVLAEGAFRPLQIYSCGPLAMQYNVAKWALANDMPAQLSLESLMACGIGACLGCALAAATPKEAGEERFVHVCEDGPIFSAGSIKWEKILAQQTAPPTWPFN